MAVHVSATLAFVKPSERSEDASRDSAPPTQRGAVIGTPAYMAPEQLRGDAADARSDQFSYCVSIVECFAAERPFMADSIGGLLEAIQEGPPSKLLAALPPGVGAVVRRGLHADPDERYPSMQALLEDLTRTGRPRRWRALWLASLLALALAAGVAGAYAARWPTSFFGPAPKAISLSPGVTPPPNAFLPHVATDITRLCMQKASASSHSEDHPPSLAFDGSNQTAWSESDPGDGTGQWIEAHLKPGTWVAEVHVRGGWASRVKSHSLDLWKHNNSFRAMRVSWQGGEQNVHFDRNKDRDVSKRVWVGAHTPQLRFTATEVDRGRFDDLCLDEIVIRGYCP